MDNQNVFSMRTFLFDYHLSSPLTSHDIKLTLFQQKEIKTVPVIRIYGSTLYGQKVCIHVHQYFPFLYAQWPTSLDSNNETLNIFGNHLENILCSNFKGKLNGPFIYDLKYCSGLSIYGYYESSHLFVQIFLTNPFLINACAKILSTNTIFDQYFIPFESHLSYLLHFMVDYNLNGISLISLDFLKQGVKFRQPLSSSPLSHLDLLKEKFIFPNQKSKSTFHYIWDSNSIPINYCHSDPIFKETISELELDCRIEDIIISKQPRNTSNNKSSNNLNFSPLLPQLNIIWNECKTYIGKDYIDHELSNSLNRNVLFDSKNEIREILKKTLYQLKRRKNEKVDHYSNISLSTQPFYIQNDNLDIKNLCEIDTESEKDIDFEDEESDKEETEDIIQFTQMTFSETNDYDLANYIPPSQSKKSNADSFSQSKHEFDELFSHKITNNKRKNELLDDIENVQLSKESISLFKTNQIDDHENVTMNTIKVQCILDERIINGNSQYLIQYFLTSYPNLKRCWVDCQKILQNKDSDILLKNWKKKQKHFNIFGNEQISHTISDTFCFNNHQNINQKNNENYITSEEDISSITSKSDDGEISSISSFENILSQKQIHTPLSLSSTHHISSIQWKRKKTTKKFPFNCVLELDTPPPSLEHLLKTLPSSFIKYRSPFFSSYNISKDQENPKKQKYDYGGKTFHIKGPKDEISSLQPVSSLLKDYFQYFQTSNQINHSSSNYILSPLLPPPSIQKIENKYFNKPLLINQENEIKPYLQLSQFPSQLYNLSPSLSNTNSSSVTQSQITPLIVPNNLPILQAKNLNYHFTILSMELLAFNNNSRFCDPKKDMVVAIALYITDDILRTMSKTHFFAENIFFTDNNYEIKKEKIAKFERPFPNDIQIIITLEEISKNIIYNPDIQIYSVSNEHELFNQFIFLCTSFNPDILVGFEVQKSSWGFLIDRANVIGLPHFKVSISRIINTKSKSKSKNKENSFKHFFQNHGAGIHITGRCIINLWRILRREIKLDHYSFEEVVKKVLGIQIPHYPSSVLSNWLFSYNTNNSLCLDAILWLMQRARFSMFIIEQLDLINTISELSGVFGLEMTDVLYRGSQIRVESLLLRMTKLWPNSLKFFMMSPTREQVNNQNCPEIIPLVFEPNSNLYTSPMLIFDFRSLYPSIMIAYNICYSTCLGKLSGILEGKMKMGVLNSTFDPSILSNIELDDLWISDNQVVFTKPSIRKGLFPSLIEQILLTRNLIQKCIKKASKENKPSLIRLMKSRHHALKMIAAVIYGYTAAGFSGRMPCVDIADSIVQTARSTLENSCKYISENWPSSQIVYGDTDSLFVYLPGFSKSQAFQIGNEIANKITSINPYPITLKFEKIYQPCFLVQKKRYVGFMFENEQQKEPILEAKGIEMIRRDSCPCVRKIMTQVINILFTTMDISRVKKYLETQWTRILSGRVSLDDFIFYKAVKMSYYQQNRSLPPAAFVSYKRCLHDHLAQPLHGERIPYIVTYGTLNQKLNDLVVSPEIFLKSSNLQINGLYYIYRQINPAINRLMLLIGIDIKKWFEYLPKPARRLNSNPLILNNSSYQMNKTGQTIIPNYYWNSTCIICGKENSNTSLCSQCLNNSQFSIHILASQLKNLNSDLFQCDRCCLLCTHLRFTINFRHCDTYDCYIFFKRNSIQNKLKILESHIGHSEIEDLL